MTKKSKSDWQKRRDAEDAGYDPKPWEGVKIHSSNTLKHELSKAALCYVLDERDYNWATEVMMNEGRVDVFSYQSPDAQPVVYEIETGVTDARRREKANQYAKGPVRDVLCFAPSDVPETFPEAVEYFREQVL